VQVCFNGTLFQYRPPSSKTTNFAFRRRRRRRRRDSHSFVVVIATVAVLATIPSSLCTFPQDRLHTFPSIPGKEAASRAKWVWGAQFAFFILFLLLCS